MRVLAPLVILCGVLGIAYLPDVMCAQTVVPSTETKPSAVAHALSGFPLAVRRARIGSCANRGCLCGHRVG